MAGGGTGQGAALGTPAPETTIKVMKEAREDGLYVGKHIFLLHIRCEGKNNPRLLLKTSGEQTPWSLGWSQRAPP